MGRMKGNTTTLTLAVSKSDSLRTTVPTHIVSQFNLQAGNKLTWELEVVNGKLKIVINPIKEVD